MHGLSFFDFGMPGHYQMRPVGNKQPSSEIQHLKLVRLFHKSCGVENHSAADDALCSEPKNTGRDQVQLMNLESDTHCMPSVVSALIANHAIKPLRQQIHELAFSFVASLQSNYSQVPFHIFPPQENSSKKQSARLPYCYPYSNEKNRLFPACGGVLVDDLDPGWTMAYDHA